jgi:hypothetical protein
LNNVLAFRNEEEIPIYIPKPVSIDAEPGDNTSSKEETSGLRVRTQTSCAMQCPNLVMWLNVLQTFIADLQAIEGAVPLESVSKYIA